MKKVFSIIETVFLIISVLFLAFVAVQKINEDSNGFMGFRTFVIVTGSMAPDLNIGDVVLVKQTEFDDIKIDDIITYKGMVSDYKDKVITHKINNIIEEDGKKIFYTKGLVNGAIDPAVYEEQVYGKVVYKFFIVSIISAIIRNKIGYILVILIPLTLIAVKEIFNIKKALNLKK